MVLTASGAAPAVWPASLSLWIVVSAPRERLLNLGGPGQNLEMVVADVGVDLDGRLIQHLPIIEGLAVAAQLYGAS